MRIFLSRFRSFLSFPIPFNISIWWNWGSIILCSLFFQVITGFFLSFYYSADSVCSFSALDLCYRDISFGFILMLLHSAGCMVYFFSLYMHLFRGLYYGSFYMIGVWFCGCILYLLSMAVAFLGYVLPWGNMSLWGATVITNLFSAIPYVGYSLVVWLWGGYSVGTPTLIRFFRFHFIVPFVVLFFSFCHLLVLHLNGRSNPLGPVLKSRFVSFDPYFTINDILGFFVVVLFGSFFSFYYPMSFYDSSNFIEANFLVTPSHIKPEWYFLAAYAVLRSIPRKLGGVLFLLFFVLIYFFLPFIHSEECYVFKSYIWSFFFYFWIITFFSLTVIGGLPVELPYTGLGLFCTFYYFFFFFIIPDKWDYWLSFMIQKYWLP